MSYPGYPPGPPGGTYPPGPPSGGTYPPGPPSTGPPQPGYPPDPGGYPPQPAPQGGPWMPFSGATPSYGPPPPGSTPYPGAAPSGPTPYPGGPPSSSAPYPGGGPAAPYPTAGGVAPSYPPPQPGGFGGPPPGAAPYPSTQQYPAPPGPSASSHAPYPTQTAGGYKVAPPPVPSAQTHYKSTHSSHAHHSQDVSKVTKGVASMSVQAHKEPPTEGTVKPHPSDPENDAKTLRTAMKGFGTDEKAIISVLAHRSNDQRQKIKGKFKALYGKDLIKELKSELSGHFEDVIIALMMTPREFDAYIVREAIEGAGTNESALIEVLCTRTNQEVDEIKSEYKSKYGRDLEKDVRSDTSGHFKRLLTSVLTGARETDGPLDRAKARADAQVLYQAGEARWGTDESKFNKILAARSYTHLRGVFNEYSKICKYDLEQSISREMSGDLKEGMLTIVKCVRDKSSYFAERLYKSMKGLGTDDDTLVRVVVSRCEVDMVQIKRIFYTKYYKTLGSFIKGDTSGDYKRVLLALTDED